MPDSFALFLFCVFRQTYLFQMICKHKRRTVVLKSFIISISFTMSVTITFYNSETDKSVDVLLSEKDAARANTDIIFATAVMNAAFQEQASWKVDSDAVASTSSETPADVNESQPVSEQPADATVETSSCQPSDQQITGVSLGESADDPEGECSLYRWTTPCVLLLLETFKNVEEKMNSGKQSQKKTWEEVAQVLKKNGHSVTGPQCAAKLRSLKKTYKGVKDHNNKSGNDRRTWQYFEVMDDIFSKKAWCAPIACASSTGHTVRRDEGDSEINSRGSLRESTPKTSVTSLLAKRIHQKEEHEKAKVRRHNERMEMDKKLLAALEKICNK